MSVDRQVYERSVYTALDWLGDVGGLLDGLREIGFWLITLVWWVIGNPLEAFLLERVFKKDRNSDADYEFPKSIDNIKGREPFIMRMGCLIAKRKQRVLEDGLNRTLKELEVDRFIRTQKRV